MKTYYGLYKVLLASSLVVIMISCDNLMQSGSDLQKEDNSKQVRAPAFNNVDPIPWDGPYRGVHIGAVYFDQQLNNVTDFVDRTGVNALRVGFPHSGQFLTQFVPKATCQTPTDSCPFNESAFDLLEDILEWAYQYRLGGGHHVRIIINPHTTPGTADNTTIAPSDEFWQDTDWYDHIIRVWDRIANTYKDDTRDVIAGYDLLNEPYIPRVDQCGDQWNNLVAILVDTIRSIGDPHPIIVQPTGQLQGGDCSGTIWQNPKSRFQGVEDLDLPADGNLVVSAHNYYPHNFTFQGLSGYSTGVSYPGSDPLNKDWLDDHLDHLRDFQSSNGNIPIMIGEFTAVRAAGPDGERYLKDLLDLAEAEGWSWMYHEFRGHNAFDSEQPYTYPYSNDLNTPRSPYTPKLALLKEYFLRNDSSHPPSDGMIRGLYRLSHPSQDDQALTYFLSEASSAVNNYDYEIDGVMIRVAPAGTSYQGVVPVYGLTHPTSYNRLYTTSTSERDTAIQTYGYIDGGIRFQAATQQTGDYIPVYRLQKGGFHRFAIGEDERDDLIADDWNLELGGQSAFYGRSN